MSDSDSSSSSSESSSTRRQRKRERREEKKERRRKEKKHSRKEKKHGKIDKHSKSHKREKQARSIITGKTIKRAEGAAADIQGEARREALRLSMNEGEDEMYGGSCSASAAGGAASLAQQARSDPALMMELMRASAAAQASKKQRLAGIKRGEGDDYAGAIGREYMAHRGANSGRKPANESAAFMKPDSGF